MLSSIPRKFALGALIFGLAILYSGCVDNTISRVSAANTTTNDTPISNKKVIATLTPSIHISAHLAASPSSTTLSHNRLAASSQSTTVTAYTQPGHTLTLLLACSGPKARDGFSVTNAHARACVYTTPGAILTISVHFCDGKADPSSILQGNVVAGDNGFYEWNWTPISDCKGERIWGWHVQVTAQMQGSSTSISEASATSPTTSTSSSFSSSSSSSP
jgi:hypothetical protein